MGIALRRWLWGMKPACVPEPSVPVRLYRELDFDRTAARSRLAEVDGFVFIIM